MKSFHFLPVIFFILLPVFCPAQNVGIGTTTPLALFHVADSNVIFSATGDISATPNDVPINGAGRRMLWYPAKAAFRVGYANNIQWNSGNIGPYSFAAGNSTTGSGPNSTALGSLTIASGDGAFAAGSQAFAGGNYSTAFGNSSSATGESSFASGATSDAIGTYSVAMGNNNITNGTSSVAMGQFCQATGDYGIAMGYQTVAGNTYSVALGYKSQANGISSFAAGYDTRANGDYSFAEGYVTQATGTSSFASGHNSLAIADNAFAGGYQSTASGAFASVALGYSPVASGQQSVAIGTNVQATGTRSTALGYNVTTNGQAGSFIIGDSYALRGQFYSNVPNQMQMVFAGGYRLYTGMSNVGVFMNSNDNSWSAVSDSTKKELVLPVNGESVLHKIAGMKLSTWNYKGQNPLQYRHYGPMAQDFYNAFGKDRIGRIGCDTLINQQDFLGVDLVAIQALEKRTEKIELLQKENTELENGLQKLSAENTALQKQLQELSETVADLKKRAEPVLTSR